MWSLLTESPILTTSPVNSCPSMVSGIYLGTALFIICRSLVHIAEQVTLTIASVGLTILGISFSITFIKPSEGITALIFNLLILQELFQIVHHLALYHAMRQNLP